MTGITFLFLSFGDTLAYHQQTYFAMLTVLRHKRDADKVVVYTDSPSYYVRIAGAVEVVALSKQTLAEWMASTGYIFRVKIMAIMDCAKRDTRSHLLFMDGDTVLLEAPDAMATLLDQGIGLMHTDEGHPSHMKGASLRMWRAVAGREIGGCTLSMRHNVWNSGVIGMPMGHGESVCKQALVVCDEILRSQVRCFTAEQYAFAVAMQEAGQLRPASPWVAHYWGNKPQWERLVTNYLVKAHMSAMPLHEEISGIDQLRLGSLPLCVRVPNTQRRLVGLVKRLFPDRVKE